MFKRLRAFGSVVLGVSVASASVAATSPPLPWRSRLADTVELRMEKRPVIGDVDQDGVASVSHLDLDAPLIAALGRDVVDYGTFVVARVGVKDLEIVKAAATALHRPLQVGRESTIAMPWGVLRPLSQAARLGLRKDLPFRAVPVPGRFLAEFAFNPTSDWLGEFEACGVTVRLQIDVRAYLLSAKDAQSILECQAADRLLWLDAWYSVDRVSAGVAPTTRAFWLQFAEGTNLVEKRSYASSSLEMTEDLTDTIAGFGYLAVEGDLNSVRELVEADPDLLSIQAATTGAPSDERQGRIISGFHDGTQLTGGPGYRAWLGTKGLLSTVNPTTVALFDTGYDNGVHPSAFHHADLLNPDRIVGLRQIVNEVVSNASAPDKYGHGSMVASIVSGDGSAGVGGGTVDTQGYTLGSGIAPTSRLYSLSPSGFTNGAIGSGYVFAQQNGATVSNHSWNAFTTGCPNCPATGYDLTAQLYDQRVLDSNPNVPSAQPMTTVVSAGNYTDTCNGLLWNTIASPATAKNVLVVGATESYRPVSQNPSVALACKPCDDTAHPGYIGRPKDLDADNVSTVAAFSGRGVPFGPSPAVARASTTRIKPDLVAPGVRVFGTTSGYVGYDHQNATACQGYWPGPGPGTVHTYGSGTSFAAPVVTGVVALFQQTMRNLVPSVVASPSLSKAALIATADTLGAVAGGGDHRPSYSSGWGRVNLNRLVDTVSRYYRNEVAADTLTLTGQTRTFVVRAPTDSKDVYVVLAWSDAAGTSTAPIAPLRNDLALKVQLGPGSIGGLYYGNFFNETVSAIDDGFSKNYITEQGITPDHINTVEAVFIPASAINANGLMRITIAAEVIAPTLTQAFSVYVYNGTVCTSNCAF